MQQQPKLLITGANGFTGSHLTRVAIERGYQVHVLEADLTDEAGVITEVTDCGVTVAVHLAAISALTHADPMDYYRVNVFGTQNLLRALSVCKYPIEKVLIASSAYVYGNSESSPFAEHALPAPNHHYAFSKLAAEGLARIFADRLPIVVSRPFNYTGVGHDERFVIPKIVNAFARKEASLTLGNLSSEREYNDVRYIVDAYLQLLERGLPGETYNLCSGNTYSVGNVLDLLVDLTGHTPEIEVDPDLLRANEIHRLCGDPTKLLATVAPGSANDLRSLLRWMLPNAETNAAVA